MTLEDIFPKLKNKDYKLASKKNRYYNCIAWAFECNTLWWWPDKKYIGFWPKQIKREVTLAAFIKAFETQGYSICENSDYEIGFQKIAIFIKENNIPTHTARQLDNGKWTSKIGELEDIEHNLFDLIGNQYGKIGVIMKRKK